MIMECNMGYSGWDHEPETGHQVKVKRIRIEYELQLIILY